MWRRGAPDGGPAGGERGGARPGEPPLPGAVDTTGDASPVSPSALVGATERAARATPADTELDINALPAARVADGRAAGHAPAAALGAADAPRARASGSAVAPAPRVTAWAEGDPGAASRGAGGGRTSSLQTLLAGASSGGAFLMRGGSDSASYRESLAQLFREVTPSAAAFSDLLGPLSAASAAASPAASASAPPGSSSSVAQPLPIPDSSSRDPTEAQERLQDAPARPEGSPVPASGGSSGPGPVSHSGPAPARSGARKGGVRIVPLALHPDGSRRRAPVLRRHTKKVRRVIDLMTYSPYFWSTVGLGILRGVLALYVWGSLAYSAVTWGRAEQYIRGNYPCVAQEHTTLVFLCHPNFWNLLTAALKLTIGSALCLASRGPRARLAYSLLEHAALPGSLTWSLYFWGARAELEGERTLPLAYNNHLAVPLVMVLEMWLSKTPFLAERAWQVVCLCAWQGLFVLIFSGVSEGCFLVPALDPNRNAVWISYPGLLVFYVACFFACYTLAQVRDHVAPCGQQRFPPEKYVRHLFGTGHGGTPYMSLDAPGSAPGTVPVPAEDPLERIAHML
jgi:hypothetical protein